jgi:hypothetical protein
VVKKNVNSQSRFGKSLNLTLIEAEYLRVGLADKADVKKYTPDTSPKAAIKIGGRFF